MSLQSLMDTMLPPTDDISAHQTSGFCRLRSGIPHGGLDFNYFVGPNGQTGLNLTHPTVFSPVDGQVVFVGGRDGTVTIVDGNGLFHQIMHLDRQDVSLGDRIVAGNPIGTMGNTNTGAQHVHYQLKDSHGHLVDPEGLWANQSPTPGVTPDPTGHVLPGGTQDCLVPDDTLQGIQDQ